MSLRGVGIAACAALRIFIVAHDHCGGRCSTARHHLFTVEFGTEFVVGCALVVVDVAEQGSDGFGERRVFLFQAERLPPVGCFSCLADMPGLRGVCVEQGFETGGHVLGAECAFGGVTENVGHTVVPGDDNESFRALVIGVPCRLCRAEAAFQGGGLGRGCQGKRCSGTGGGHTFGGEELLCYLPCLRFFAGLG